jgi:hypothetical protein
MNGNTNMFIMQAVFFLVGNSAMRESLIVISGVWISTRLPVIYIQGVS